MPKKILNFGSLNIDFVYHVKRIVTEGETVHSSKLLKHLGGKGNNQSHALARAGVDVYHAGCVGNDGLQLLHSLEKEKVNTDWIRVTNNPTGHAIIQIDDFAENAIIVHGGANKNITTTHIDEVIDYLQPQDIILLQNEINNIEYIINKARNKNIYIIFNSAPIDQHIHTALPCIQWLILNQHEIAYIYPQLSAQEAMNKLRDKYPDLKITLTLGASGVLHSEDSSSNIIYQEATKVNPVDTTGAGDTFIGYLIASWLQGKDISNCLQLACRAAAISVTRIGAVSSIPRLIELH